MPDSGDRSFDKELQDRRNAIYSYIMSRPFIDSACSSHIRDASLHSLGLGGKSLRPALLLLACGAVGANEGIATPAAAAIEVCHTWTLIHDDVIDRDLKRRGRETIHEEFRRRAVEEFGYSDAEAKHYGTSIAILSGDLLQGWAVSLLCELSFEKHLAPALALHLINELMTKVQNTLVEGEVLDIQYSKLPIDSVDEVLVLDMLKKKTAVLYEYAGQAGAMIGIGCCDPNASLVRGIAEFAQKCGLAFQLRDDILGVIGNEQVLGKPVGADLREGKRTIIVRQAYMNASTAQRSLLMNTLGNRLATEREVAEATGLLIELGGVQRAQDIAMAYVKDAKACLDVLPDSPHRRLLVDWAEYLVERGS